MMSCATADAQKFLSEAQTIDGADKTDGDGYFSKLLSAPMSTCSTSGATRDTRDVS